MSPGAREQLPGRARRLDGGRLDARARLPERDGVRGGLRPGGRAAPGGRGPDRNGGVLPGFGDQREIELLVEAGFTPVEAIQVATLNGARYLGREGEIGTIAAGKRADLVLVKGDPARTIADIERSRSCSRTAWATTRRSSSSRCAGRSGSGESRPGRRGREGGRAGREGVRA